MSYGFNEMYFDGIIMPVVPSKIKTDIPNRNLSLDMVSGYEAVVQVPPGRHILEFELLLPNIEYPFANYPNGFQNAIYYIQKLLELKNTSKPFEFTYIRVLYGDKVYDTTANVYFEKLDFIEDVSNSGNDVIAEVSLKIAEYNKSSEEIQILLPTVLDAIKPFSVFANATEAKDITSVFKLDTRDNTGTVISTGTQAGVPKVPETIKTGPLDSLQKIAKKVYGDASFAEKIYEENKQTLDGICQAFGLPKLSFLPDTALKMPNIPSGILEYIKTGTLNNPLSQFSKSYDDIIKYVNDSKKIVPSVPIDKIPNGVL